MKQSGDGFPSVNVNVVKITWARNEVTRLRKVFLIIISKEIPTYFGIHYCFNKIGLLSSATVKLHLDRQKVFIAIFIGTKTKSMVTIW